MLGAVGGVLHLQSLLRRNQTNASIRHHKHITHYNSSKPKPIMAISGLAHWRLSHRVCKKITDANAVFLRTTADQLRRFLLFLVSEYLCVCSRPKVSEDQKHD